MDIETVTIFIIGSALGFGPSFWLLRRVERGLRAWQLGQGTPAPDRARFIGWIKRSVFDEAMAAVAMYEADARRPVARSQGSAGARDSLPLRESTRQKIDKALALVPEFFSPRAAQTYASIFRHGPEAVRGASRDYRSQVGTAIALLCSELSRGPSSSAASTRRSTTMRLRINSKTSG